METLIRQNAVEFKEPEKSLKENAVNQSDSGCETSTTKSTEEILNTSTNTIENIDVLILRRDPQTNRKLINKTAYAKLQRSLSPTRNSQLNSLKSKYEKSDTENENEASDFKLTKSELALIRPKSKLPIPTPRNGIKSEIISPSQKVSEKVKQRHSLMLDKKTKKRDENSNEVFRKSSSSSGEFITIIPRSESAETVDKFEKELSFFIMDKKVKDKKRTNSFRRIFTGKIFGKEKKKKEEPDNILQQKRNVQSDNLENENNSSRQSPHRNSLGNSNIPKPLPQGIRRQIPPPNINMQELEKRYAQMHVKEFNNIKQNFENHSSVNETDQVPTISPGPMDFSKIPNINKFIDTSSSASVESDKDNSGRNLTDQENPYKSLRIADHQRDTPPRAQELRQNQDVRLVNPKALIPINSERPLPNPYQNNKPVISPKPQLNPLNRNLLTNSLSPSPKMAQHFNFDSEKKPFSSDGKNSLPLLDETYGTVFDSVDKKKDVWVRNQPTKLIQKPPRSPSLEPSKLRLPPNRDIGPMSPRMRSPIPQHHVSAEKLIATELLRTSRSPTPTKRKTNNLSSSYQRLEMGVDYADNPIIQRNENIRAKPVLNSKPPISRTSDNINIQKDSALSPNYEDRDNQSSFPRVPETAYLQGTRVSPNYENRSLQMSPTPRIPESRQLQGSSQISPNYENRNYQSSSSLRMSENASLQRNGQLPPNYENRNHQSSPMSRASENASIQSRNSNLQPNYDNIYRQQSPAFGSQDRSMGFSVVDSSVMRSPTPNSVLHNPELSILRPHSSRSSTPVDQRISNSTQTPSPQKEEMRRSVEAYYWKEIKKLKEQENFDLYFYQMQMMPFGYAEDPIYFRRSRSSSPSSQRNGRRSLSLPREPKSQITNVDVTDNYGRFQPAPIPEGRAVVNYPNPAYYQQNFRRNAPERRTIDSVPRSNSNTIYRPIFKRGSLTTPVRELVEDQQQKKVSFTSGKEKEVWPTKNGYTQSPPQRRIENIRNDSMDDDVFFPSPQQQTTKLIVDGKEIYGYANRPYDNQVSRQQDPHYQNANFYKQIHKEPVYNTRSNQLEESSRIPVGMTRYNSMQLVEPAYEPQQRVTRRMSFDNSQGYVSKPQNVAQNMPRRQIYMKDDIYGYFGGYVPNDQQQNIVYSSRQSIAEPTYGYNRGVPKQVSVRDQVCDMYGQIHDRDSPSLNVRRSGVMLGQLQPAQNSYSQLPNQTFVRNSRLTASANDMYKRYQNVNSRYQNNLVFDRYQAQNDRPPSRPLPPVPADKKVYYRQNADSIQEFSDVQKTSSLGKTGKSKIRGMIDQAGQTSRANGSKKNVNVERLILLEQLHLLKRQQQLEMNKWQWQQYQEDHKRQHLETKGSEDLSILDLKKLVLLEELKLLRLKIRMEINLK